MDMLKFNEKLSKQDIFLLISKMLIVLFIFYYGWFQMVFFNIPNMSLLLGSGAVFFVSFHALIHKKNFIDAISVEVIYWLIFSIYSLFIGIFIAYNQSYLLDAIFTFIQHLIFMYCISYISLQERSVNFIINTLILFAIVCGFTTYFRGVYVYSNRISMSQLTNPNTLGYIMVLGIFSVLFKMNINFRKKPKVVLQFIIFLVLFYILILTGSRKHLIATIILVISWIIVIFKNEFSKFVKKQKYSLLLMITILVPFGYFMFRIIRESATYVRLLNLFESGDNTRIKMYSVALDLFVKHPIFGIGFNNFRVVSGFNTYSHSTYAEVLANTGIIGTLLYFIPYITLLCKFIKYVKIKNTKVKELKLILALFVVLLFLGIGVIHFYELYSSLAFSVIISYILLLKRNKAGVQISG